MKLPLSERSGPSLLHILICVFFKLMDGAACLHGCLLLTLYSVWF